MPIKLPSGLAGEVRGLSGRDFRYLTDQKKIRENEVEDFILKSCWTSTVEEGPYSFGGKDPDWTKILIGDRTGMMLAVREASYPGDPFPMKLKCPSCDRPVDWEIDIGKYLKEKMQPLSKEDANVFKNGNRFEDKIPFDGRAFVYKLRTGGDAKKLLFRLDQQSQGSRKQQEKRNPFVAGITDSIVKIDGIAENFDAKFDYLEDLPARALDSLMALMQEHDCGVDTTIEVECRRFSCGGSTFEVELPFGQRAFFLPSSTKKKTTKAPEETEGNDLAEDLDPLAG